MKQKCDEIIYFLLKNKDIYIKFYYEDPWALSTLTSSSVAMRTLDACSVDTLVQSRAR